MLFPVVYNFRGLGKIFSAFITLLSMLLVSGVAISDAHAIDRSKITICNDEGEWPPYYYFKRSEDDGTRTDSLKGYDIDYLKHIFEKHSLEFTFDMIPWKRCLSEVEKGGHM